MSRKLLWILLLAAVCFTSIDAFAFGGGGHHRVSTRYKIGVDSMGIHVDPDNPIVPPDYRNCDSTTEELVGHECCLKTLIYTDGTEIKCCNNNRELFNGKCVAKCPTGFSRKADGTCGNCTTDANCGGQHCVSGTCQDCPTGQWKRATGECVGCGDLSTFTDEMTAEQCAVCDTTEYPRKLFEKDNKTYCGRVTCPSGYLHDDVGDCEECSGLMAFETTAQECTSCTTNPRKIFDASGYCGLVTCPSGYLHDELGHCYSCDETAEFTTTQAECTLCSPHRVWNSTNNSCDLTCTTDADCGGQHCVSGTCQKKCDEGYVLENDTCVEINGKSCATTYTNADCGGEGSGYYCDVTGSNCYTKDAGICKPIGARHMD